MWITDWTARAACKGTDPDELFVQGAAQNRAKLICRGCTVRTECLADALDNRIESVGPQEIEPHIRKRNGIAPRWSSAFAESPQRLAPCAGRRQPIQIRHP